MTRRITLRRLLTALFLGCTIILAGCAGATPAATPTAAPALSATPAALPPGQLPDFVLNNSARVQRAYRTALANPVAFTKIPCLCGCVHEPTEHRYLLDCFVKEIRPDGAVVFDRHGATWGGCITEALDVADGLAAGLPLKEIRAQIEKKYPGDPTNTPPIE